MIALKRLAHPGLGELIRQALDADTPGAAQAAIRVLIRALRVERDATVIPPELAAQTVFRWFSGNDRTAGDIDTLTAFLDLMGETAHQPAKPLLEGYLDHPSEMVRRSAYRALLSMSRRDEPERYLSRGLSDPARSVRLALYRQAQRQHIAVASGLIPKEPPASELRRGETGLLGLSPDAEADTRLAGIADASREDETTRLQALKWLLQRQAAGHAQAPLTGDYDTPELQAGRLRLLGHRWQAIRPLASPPQDLLDALETNQEAPLAAAIRILADRPEAWAGHRLLALLADRDRPLPARRLILQTVSGKPARSFRLAMTKLLRQPGDPLFRQALALAPDAPANRALLEGLIGDPGLDEDRRFAAVNRLCALDFDACIVALNIEADTNSRLHTAMWKN